MLVQCLLDLLQDDPGYDLRRMTIRRIDQNIGATRVKIANTDLYIWMLSATLYSFPLLDLLFWILRVGLALDGMLFPFVNTENSIVVYIVCRSFLS